MWRYVIVGVFVVSSFIATVVAVNADDGGGMRGEQNGVSEIKDR